MTLLAGALALGLLLAIAAQGAWLALRVVGVLDVTGAGALAAGAATTVLLLVDGHAPPALATLAGAGAGAAAGGVAGVLQTRGRLDPVLAGVLVAVAIHVALLRALGGAPLAVGDAPTLATRAALLGARVAGTDAVVVAGARIAVGELATLAGLLLVVLATAGALALALRSDAGLALRAAGEAPGMLRALGGHPERLRVVGLLLANALLGLAGALAVQHLGAWTAWDGAGAIVWALASVLVGEALTRPPTPGIALAGTVLAALLLRVLASLATVAGAQPADATLAVAAVVTIALAAAGRRRRAAVA